MGRRNKDGGDDMKQEIKKTLDCYVDMLKLSTNRVYRTQIRKELDAYVHRIEKNGSKRAEYLVYVFERSNDGKN